MTKMKKKNNRSSLVKIYHEVFVGVSLITNEIPRDKINRIWAKI